MPILLNVGVDMAKDAVVVACAEHSFPVHPVPNQRVPLRTWLKSLPVGSRVGLKSTGASHEVLADRAQASGHTLFLLHYLETRHDAKAMGTRAKTDRVNADLIVRLKGTLKQTMRHLGGFATELKAVMGNVDALLAKIDATMAALAACSRHHREAQHRWQTIVGVELLVGSSLTNPLERVPFRKTDAFVAFIGLDPRANDSGQNQAPTVVQTRPRLVAPLAG